MAATASQTNLAGLPRRLVQDGIVSEAKLAEARRELKAAERDRDRATKLAARKRKARG